MLKELSIQSNTGIYKVEVTENAFAQFSSYSPEKTQFIIDKNVYRLYESSFKKYFQNYKIIQIEALETNKNVDLVSSFVKQLMDNQVKIDHTLVAFGGGIIQDVTCFIASTLFRGMKWDFVPTTLLAQADSCIGSKSSINVGEFKNLMGTFYPPQKIILDVSFLDTLEHKDILSGVGEILKVHMIKDISKFEKVSEKYDEMLTDKNTLLDFIWHSLLYKKEMIELDEFDRGPRNVMNYGHTYGHAIEAATNFGIPHGIAVSLGMDMANYQSFKMNRITEDQFLRWHSCLRKNFKDYVNVQVPTDDFLSAISKDKKNIGTELSLILVRNEGAIEKIRVKKDEKFIENCSMFLEKYFYNNYI